MLIQKMRSEPTNEAHTQRQRQEADREVAGEGTCEERQTAAETRREPRNDAHTHKADDRQIDRSPATEPTKRLRLRQPAKGKRTSVRGIGERERERSPLEEQERANRA